MAEVNNTPVYAVSTNVTSSLGQDVAAHWDAVADGRIGIQEYNDAAFSKTPFWGSRIDNKGWDAIDAAITKENLSGFEKLALFSATNALQQCNSIDLSETVFILSTTKGNIELLDEHDESRLMLDVSAVTIAKELGIDNKPIVISHACVSGSIALLYALRLLNSGRYKHAVVTGCDRFTRFVLSGFQSFQAIANGPCRPFDANRTGINLGEAAATIVLSASKDTDALAMLRSGATSNDANHISGPSRTGEELSMAINRALAEAGLTSSDISMASAHGTATPYNDEMESKALGLSGLASVPVHSMKSYTGHTLGAAGVLESVMSIEAILQQQLIPSAGYEQHGVPVEINVTTRMEAAPVTHVLKTASGFGGSNAAIIWSKL